MKDDSLTRHEAYWTEGEARDSRWLITCDHATNRVPGWVGGGDLGIAPEDIPHLFQKFYRSHRSRETVAGTGIGLYISKAIIESHGGTIAVRSAEGKGSTFTVSIPTYASIADKLSAAHNSNEAFISQGRGWIKNHSMFRG